MATGRNLNNEVLVVDDDRAIRTMVSATLRKRGYEVTLADNGRAGAEHVCAAPTRFSLIIMDYRMPEMDGLSACQVIRQCASAAPIFLMSAEKLVLDFAEIGVQEFLPKPFIATDLIALVDRYLVR